MAHYFSVPIRGVGTRDIEYFGSYASRVAKWHMVSVHQFFDHLVAWRRSHSEAVGITIPRFNIELLTNGTLSNLALLVSIMELGLGVDGLRATTLLPLSDVSGHRSNTMLKSGRNWCPVCMAEQEASGDEAYLKLVWQIEFIERCDIHAVALHNSCPHCGRLQRFKSRDLDLSVCAYCGKKLLDGCVIEAARKPSLGERDLIEVVEAVARNPVISFKENGPEIFFRRCQESFTRSALSAEIGDTFRVRTNFVRARLRTLLKMANFFQVPLLRILEDPVGASELTSKALFDSGKAPSQIRPRNDGATSAELEADLLRVLNAGGTPETLRSICRRHSVSLGFAYFWCPALCAALGAKRRKWLLDRKAHRLVRLRESDVSELVAKYVKGEIWLMRDLIKQIHGLTSVPIYMIRRYMRLGRVRRGSPRKSRWSNRTFKAASRI